MEKKKIVLVDTDEDYLSILEYKVVEEWGDAADIEIITQLGYFNQYFNQPRDIYLLVIDEILYSYEKNINKQNINYIFLLSENERDVDIDGSGVNFQKIYKYSSIPNIFQQIQKKIGFTLNPQNIEKTSVSIVGAVCGGVGKTLCALGICRDLADSGKRVLYINTEKLQDFGHYIGDFQWMGAEFGYTMAINDARIIMNWQEAIGQQGFDYLKPFEKLSLSYQITTDSYLFLTERVRDERLYDHIVVEIPVEIDRSMMRFLDMADKIFMICCQDKRCASKLEQFIQSMTLSEEKYIFICNRFKADRRNDLERSPVIQRCCISCYIPELQEPLSLESLIESGALRPGTFIF